MTVGSRHVGVCIYSEGWESVRWSVWTRCLKDGHQCVGLCEEVCHCVGVCVFTLLFEEGRSQCIGLCVL